MNKIYEISAEDKNGKKHFWNLAQENLIDAQKDAMIKVHQNEYNTDSVEVYEKGYAIVPSYFDDITDITNSLEDFNENADVGQKAFIGEWIFKIDSTGENDCLTVNVKGEKI